MLLVASNRPLLLQAAPSCFKLALCHFSTTPVFGHGFSAGSGGKVGRNAGKWKSSTQMGFPGRKIHDRKVKKLKKWHTAGNWGSEELDRCIRAAGNQPAGNSAHGETHGKPRKEPNPRAPAPQKKRRSQSSAAHASHRRPNRTHILADERQGLFQYQNAFRSSRLTPCSENA